MHASSGRKTNIYQNVTIVPHKKWRALDSGDVCPYDSSGDSYTMNCCRMPSMKIYTMLCQILPAPLQGGDTAQIHLIIA